MSDYAIAHGDVLECLRELPSNEFDALLCDPPYGFAFMGKRWDYDVPSVDVWREALRVLKPGAPLLSFGGARTFHRIAIGIEDAGFELRDCLMWLYGKGFPKSLDVSRGSGAAWDGYGTALKPAYEPIILARKPLIGTMAENVQTWGVGGLAIDACRIGRAEGDRTEYGRESALPEKTRNAMGAFSENAPYEPHDAGRWPANLLLDDESAAALDASVPPTKSVPFKANKASGAVLDMATRTAGGYDEPASGPSRFFYCAKVSTKEREVGCDALPMRTAGEMTGSNEDDARLESPRTGAGRTGGARNHHPTLKPIALTRWLASLIKPPTPGAQLLIPYSGAGSEVIGALQAGWPLVFGIEGEAEYIEIAHARIAAQVKGSK